MLKVERVISPYSIRNDKCGEKLFIENKDFIFVIDAPFMWWLDVDGIRYGFELDEFNSDDIVNLPLSTSVKGVLCLSYQELVEICEDYIQGMYKYTGRSYQFPNEREWKDFCETVLDIRGIRDLIKEE